MTKLSTFFLCFSLLLCLLAGSSIAHPSAIDDMELSELEKRQDSNSTSVSSVSSSSTSTTTRTTMLPTTSRISRTIRTTSVTPSTSSSTSTASPLLTTETSTTSPSTSTPSTSTPQQTPTTSNPTSQPTTTDQPVETVTPTTHVVIATLFTTITSNGSAFTSAYVASSTTVETPSGTGNQASDVSGGGGITPTTRNTIIGVVVGVGGALLFGGLAIVAWRLKRKNKSPVDEDDLMRRDGSPLAAGREIHPASPEQSPFKTTLDQYHKPPGVVNASSNF